VSKSKGLREKKKKRGFGKKGKKEVNLGLHNKKGSRREGADSPHKKRKNSSYNKTEGKRKAGGRGMLHSLKKWDKYRSKVNGHEEFI